jgi:hypothetical protein
MKRQLAHKSIPARYSCYNAIKQMKSSTPGRIIAGAYFS